MNEPVDLTLSDPPEQEPDMSSELLEGLNDAQKEAVTASPKGGVFAAGVPGCGKTKTLTSRVAYLVTHYGLEPSRLVVVTFTNKAANEMKERLAKLLGDTAGDLVLGTFHSICARYLRRYGTLISLPHNFSILDRDDATAVVKRVIATIPNFPSKAFKKMKPVNFLDRISNAKSKMMTPETYKVDVQHNPNRNEREWIYVVWRAYQDELARTNSVDFDDLLNLGHELFEKNPHIVARIQSVLVDEFQDTSVTQYEIAKFIAKPSGSMTVVGDPDQSIYGWRNAEVENLNRMLKDFYPCREIFLEENYRSTNAILETALAVIQQDKKRVDKSLYSSHPAGPPVVLNKLNNATHEGAWIASNITKLSKDLDGLVKYDDFAILLRAGYQSLAIELALTEAGIPSIFRGGHKFFERVEVKDILSYLQLVSNPNHSAALERVLNVPKRTLGPKALKDIFGEAKSKRTTEWDVLTSVADQAKGALTLSTQATNGIKRFVASIRTCRKKALTTKSVVDLITFIIKNFNYKAHLEKTYGAQANDRLLNIEELKNYAVLVAKEGSAQELKTEEVTAADEDILVAGPSSTVAETSSSSAKGKKVVTKKSPKGTAKSKTTKGTKSGTKGKGTKKAEESDDYEDEEEESEDGDDTTDDLSIAVNGDLDDFLCATSLATDHDTQSATSDGKVPKVVLSTVHSAKGLEWPIVFIPGVEDGTFPFYLADTTKQIDEERRLLYVAITRAQTHCFLSYVSKRLAGGVDRHKTLSDFISFLPKKQFQKLVSNVPHVTEKIKEEVSKVLGRTLDTGEEEEGESDIEVEVKPSTSSKKDKTKKRPAPVAEAKPGKAKKTKA